MGYSVASFLKMWAVMATWRRSVCTCLAFATVEMKSLRSPFLEMSSTRGSSEDSMISLLFSGAMMDSLSFLNFSRFSKERQCCYCPINEGGRFLIGHIGRFTCQRIIFRQTYVLGIAPKTKIGSSKNLVTFLKSLHIFAYCFNFPG